MKRNCRILLVQPIVGLLDQVKDKPAIPLSLITAASNMRRDFEVAILDQRTDPNWQEALVEELRLRPVLVGVTAMLGEQIKYALQVARVVKEHSEIPVVWGGSQGSIMPEITVRHPDVDYVLQGDGEESLPLLARALATGSRLSHVPGVWWKDSRGNPTHVMPRVRIDLNAQDDPLYEIYDINAIRGYMPERFGRPTIDMETSRGCIYRCAFCYQPFLNGGWRAINAERVKERIDRLNRDYEIDSFWFIDDEFFIDLDRSRGIIEYMDRHSYLWSIQGVTIRSVSRMDKEYLAMLRHAGCRQLNIGVESGSPRILKMVHKPITPEEVLEINRRLGDADIVPSYYFIVGFPDETAEDFHQTISLVWQLLKENPRAKVMNVGTYSPYPNSELEKRCIELGYRPPRNLEDYVHYGVDYESLPWQVGNRDIIGANFCNYFIDRKVDDLEVAPWLKLGCRLYRPVARWRFKNGRFGFPVDINIGRRLKEMIRS